MVRRSSHRCSHAPRRYAGVLGGGLALAGVCVGTIGGVGGCASPADPVAPPTGGGVFELDEALFASTVSPVLLENGCASMACHGGGIRGSFRLSPDSLPDVAYDFVQASEQVDPWAPDDSPLLRKPLSRDAGGAPHQHEPFASTDDPGYVAIRDWILAGELR